MISFVRQKSLSFSNDASYLCVDRERNAKNLYTTKQPLPQTYFSDRLKILNPKVILDAYLVHSLKYILVMDRVPKKFDKSHFSANSGFKKIKKFQFLLADPIHPIIK